VPYTDLLWRGDLTKREDLLSDTFLDLHVRKRHRSSAKVLAIGIGRMRSGGDTMPAGENYGFVHRLAVPGVDTAGNVGGREEGDQFLVLAGPLADVTIEIDRMCTIAEHPCNFSLIPVSAASC
jgi:hypothetical protein